MFDEINVIVLQSLLLPIELAVG